MLFYKKLGTGWKNKSKKICLIFAHENTIVEFSKVFPEKKILKLANLISYYFFYFNKDKIEEVYFESQFEGEVKKIVNLIYQCKFFKIIPHFLEPDCYKYKNHYMGGFCIEPYIFGETERSWLEELLLNPPLIDDGTKKKAQLVFELYIKLKISKQAVTLFPFVQDKKNFQKAICIVINDSCNNEIEYILSAIKIGKIALEENPDSKVYFYDTRQADLTNHQLEIIRVDSNQISFIDFLESVSCIYTDNSELVLEAILRGKKVISFSYSFYCGWGLTEDRFRIDDERRNLTIFEFFIIVYLLYPLYYKHHDIITGFLYVLFRNLEYKQRDFVLVFNRKFIKKNFSQILTSKNWPIIFKADFFVSYYYRNQYIQKLVKEIIQQPSYKSRLLLLHLVIGKFKCSKNMLSLFCNNFSEKLTENELSLYMNEFKIRYPFFDDKLKINKWYFFILVKIYLKNLLLMSSKNGIINSMGFFDINSYQYCSKLANSYFNQFDMSSALMLRRIIVYLHGNIAKNFLELAKIYSLVNEEDFVIKNLSLAISFQSNLTSSFMISKVVREKYLLLDIVYSMINQTTSKRFALIYAQLFTSKYLNCISQLNNIPDYRKIGLFYCQIYSKLLFREGKYEELIKFNTNKIKYYPKSISLYTDLLLALRVTGKEKELALLCEKLKENNKISKNYYTSAYMIFDKKRSFELLKNSYLRKILQEKFFDKFIPIEKINQIELKAKILVINKLELANFIRYSYLLPYIASFLKNYHVVFSCESRLYELFKMNYADLNFISVKQKSWIVGMNVIDDYNLLPYFDMHVAFDNHLFSQLANFDYIMCFEDFLPVFITQNEPNVIRKVFTVCYEKTGKKFWEQRFNTDKLLVGLCYRSSVTNYFREKFFFELIDFVPLFELEDVLFINLVSGDCLYEKEWILANYKDKMIFMNQVDLHNDFINISRLIDQLDVVIGIGTTNTELSGLLGKKTFLLSSTNAHCWRIKNLFQDIWFESIINYQVDKKNFFCKSELIEKVKKDLIIMLSNKNKYNIDK